MKSFIAACVFIAAVAVAAPYVLPSLGTAPAVSSSKAFQTTGVRLDDPGQNLIGN